MYSDKPNADILAELTERNLVNAFISLPPSHRKEYIKWIEEAKKHETRFNRIVKMCDMVAAGLKNR